ncbi:MAG: hypothetical protein AAF493_29545 [Pseudomonadota bacterium]
MSREIYLDIDGVCVDFIRPAFRAHGLEPDPLLGVWARDHVGDFFPHHGLGIDVDAFWTSIANAGERFWTDLEPYPWFQTLFSRLSELGHVVFCTSTTRAPSSASGKLRWIQKRFGREYADFILTAHKDRLAHPNAFLIDDYDANVEKFSQRGGHGIVFPQFWNSNHAVADQRIDYVIHRIIESTR